MWYTRVKLRMSSRLTASSAPLATAAAVVEDAAGASGCFSGFCWAWAVGIASAPRATTRARRRGCWRIPVSLMPFAQPAARVDGLAALAQLEIGAVVAGGRRGGTDGFAGLHRVAHAVQQRFVVAVQTHEAIAVVHDDHHAVATQEADEHHATPCHRFHLAAAGRDDDDAVAVRMHRAAGRPGQVAAQV